MAKQQITISFKNNTKESKMFELLNNFEDKSGEIKPVLYKYFVLGYRFENEIARNGNGKIQPVNKVEEFEEEEIDITDF